MGACIYVTVRYVGALRNSTDMNLHVTMFRYALSVYLTCVFMAYPPCFSVFRTRFTFSDDVFTLDCFFHLTFHFFQFVQQLELIQNGSMPCLLSCLR